jgi:hypothetical protein
VIAFKPQIAYFAAYRAEDQLERLMAHMRQAAPQVPGTNNATAQTRDDPLGDTRYDLIMRYTERLRHIQSTREFQEFSRRHMEEFPPSGDWRSVYSRCFPAAV